MLRAVGRRAEPPLAKIIKKSEEDLSISAKDINVGMVGKLPAKKKAVKKNAGTARKGATTKRSVRRTNALK